MFRAFNNMKLFFCIFLWETSKPRLLQKFLLHDVTTIFGKTDKVRQAFKLPYFLSVSFSRLNTGRKKTAPSYLRENEKISTDGQVIKQEIRPQPKRPPRERSFQTGTGEGALLLRIIGMKKGEENKNFELIYFLLNQTFRAS